MDFPLQGLVDCVISLDIHPSRVEYLMTALFIVKIAVLLRQSDDMFTIQPFAKMMDI